MEVQGQKSATEKAGTRVVVAGKERVLASEAGVQKYGKDEYDLMLRLLAWLERGQRDAIRQQYVDLLGIERMNAAEQERKLYDNKAYQKAMSEAEAAAQRDKRLLREVFDRTVRARVLEERFRIRHERLRRMRVAIRGRLEDKAKDYETKKRLYDKRFEEIETVAYTSGSARIEEDRKRYETLSIELEKKIKEENDSIARVQKAGEEADRMRETLERSMKESRAALGEVMEILRKAHHRLAITDAPKIAPPPPAAEEPPKT